MTSTYAKSDAEKRVNNHVSSLSLPEIPKVTILFWKGVKSILDGLFTLIGLTYPSQKNRLPPPTNPVVMLPAHTLVNLIKRREVRCEEVIQCYIERIKQVNPMINAMVDDNFTEALSQARSIDSMLSEGVESVQHLPLLGLPFTAKDSTEIKGHIHAAGSWHRRDVLGKNDAPVITRLKEAGAIFLGLTNVPEILLWWDSNNMLFGRTNNPFDLSHVAGGSSGGEAALISSRGSLFGIGSDIGGSLRIPSSFCGIIGHKPSPGLVPPIGMFPNCTEETFQYATFGPLGRCVKDVALLLSVMIPEKEKYRFPLALDNLHLPLPRSGVKLYFMNGLPAHPLVSPTDPEIVIAMRKVVDHLKRSLRVEPEEVYFRELTHTVDMWAANMTQFDSRTLEDTLSECTGQPVNGYWELLKSIFRMSNHSFNLMFFTLIQNILSPTKDPKKCEYLKKMSQKVKEDVRRKLGPRGILLCPTLPIPAPKHSTTVLKGMDISSCVCFNVLGLPSTQVPVGRFSSGLPIGIQVVSAPDNDLLCLSIAHNLEKAFGGSPIP